MLSNAQLDYLAQQIARAMGRGGLGGYHSGPSSSSSRSSNPYLEDMRRVAAQEERLAETMDYLRNDLKNLPFSKLINTLHEAAEAYKMTAKQANQTAASGGMSGTQYANLNGFATKAAAGVGLLQNALSSLGQIAGQIHPILGKVGSIIGGRSLDPTSTIQFLTSYNKNLLAISATYTQMGASMGQTENSMKRIRNATGLTYEDTKSLMEAYASGFNFTSITRGEQLMLNLKRAVGGNVQEMQNMMQALSGIVQKFPDLEKMITRLDSFDKKQLAIRSMSLVASGQMSLTEARQISKYTAGSASAGGGEANAQVDRMNRSQQIFEDVALSVGKAWDRTLKELLPDLEEIVGKNTEAWGRSIQALQYFEMRMLAASGILGAFVGIIGGASSILNFLRTSIQSQGVAQRLATVSLNGLSASAQRAAMNLSLSGGGPGSVGKFGNAMGAASAGLGGGMAGAMIGGEIGSAVHSMFKAASYRESMGDRMTRTGVSVASGALSGAAIGAMIGSAVPVLGTAIGAVVGGIGGGIVTYMKNASKDAATIKEEFDKITESAKKSEEHFRKASEQQMAMADASGKGAKEAASKSMEAMRSGDTESARKLRILSDQNIQKNVLSKKMAGISAGIAEEESNKQRISQLPVESGSFWWKENAGMTAGVKGSLVDSSEESINKMKKQLADYQKTMDSINAGLEKEGGTSAKSITSDSSKEFAKIQKDAAEKAMAEVENAMNSGELPSFLQDIQSKHDASVGEKSVRNNMGVFDSEMGRQFGLDYKEIEGISNKDGRVKVDNASKDKIFAKIKAAEARRSELEEKAKESGPNGGDRFKEQINDLDSVIGMMSMQYQLQTEITMEEDNRKRAIEQASTAKLSTLNIEKKGLQELVSSSDAHLQSLLKVQAATGNVNTKAIADATKIAAEEAERLVDLTNKLATTQAGLNKNSRGVAAAEEKKLNDKLDVKSQSYEKDPKERLKIEHDLAALKEKNGASLSAMAAGERNLAKENLDAQQKYLDIIMAQTTAFDPQIKFAKEKLALAGEEIKIADARGARGTEATKPREAQRSAIYEEISAQGRAHQAALEAQAKQNEKLVALEKERLDPLKAGAALEEKIKTMNGNVQVIKEKVLSTAKEQVQAELQLVQAANDVANSNKMNIDLAKGQAGVMQSQIDLADSLGLGVQASAKMRMDYDKQLNKQLDEQNVGYQRILDMQNEIESKVASGAMTQQQGEIALNALTLQRQQAQMAITSTQKEQINNMKSLRDVYLSALTAINTGTGVITKMMVDQNKNMGSFLSAGGINAVQSYGTGGAGVGAGREGSTRMSIGGGGQLGFSGPMGGNDPHSVHGTFKGGGRGASGLDNMRQKMLNIFHGEGGGANEAVDANQRGRSGTGAAMSANPNINSSGYNMTTPAGAAQRVYDQKRVDDARRTSSGSPQSNAGGAGGFAGVNVVVNVSDIDKLAEAVASKLKQTMSGLSQQIADATSSKVSGSGGIAAQPHIA